MKKAPPVRGMIPLDHHVHLGDQSILSVDVLVDTLLGGITGLAAKNTEKRILTYDKSILLPRVTEIDKGLFAQIQRNDEIGYFYRSREVLSDFHIIAVGCETDIPDGSDARRVVECIHSNGRKAILPHPYIKGGLVRRASECGILLEDGTNPMVSELAQMTGIVEEHNGQAVDLRPVRKNLKLSNQWAIDLISKLGKAGERYVSLAGSDTHYLAGQVRTSATYVPNWVNCFEALEASFAPGLQLHKSYVNKLSLLQGFVVSRF